MKTATDNPFDATNNPFTPSSTGGPAVPSNGGDSAAADPQMNNSFADQAGGDSFQADPSNQQNSQNTAMRHVVACLSCGQTGTMRKMAKVMSCGDCGSDELTYFSVKTAEYGGDVHQVQYEADWKAGYEDGAEERPRRTDATPEYSSGYDRGARDLADGTLAKWRQQQDNFSSQVWARKVAADNPFAKKDDDEKKDKGDKDAPDPNAPPAAPDPNAQPPQPAAPQAPGDPNQAPPAAPADQAATTGGDPGQLGTAPAGGDAGAVQPPADPNAPPVPGNPQQLGNDPLDIAQQTLDSVVEQANALGHAAMETAYDVDQMFSEWRCSNCGVEGRGDISEDGQVAFSGDLLNQPQGCAMPQGNPDNPQDPNAQLQQADENGAVPPVGGDAPPQAPQSKQSRRRWFSGMPLGRSKKAANDLNNERPELDDHNTDADTSGAPLAEERDEKVARIAENILKTNPGMNQVTAMSFARATVRQYPSILATGAEAKCGEEHPHALWDDGKPMVCSSYAEHGGNHEDRSRLEETGTITSWENRGKRS